MDVPGFDGDFCAEGLKTFEVQVDWPGADDAASRKRDGGVFQAAEQGSHDADRTAHFADEVVIADAFDFASLDADGVAFGTDLSAEPDEDLRHEFNVAQVWHAPDDAGLVGQ